MEQTREESTFRASAKAHHVYQWLVLLLLCPTLLLLDVFVAFPVALALWLSGAIAIRRRLAAQRDPVLARVMQVDSNGSLASLAACGRVYTSLVAFGWHQILRLFVRLGKPRTVFVVYLNNYSLMRKFFCFGTHEVITRAGLFPGYMCPDNPWVLMMGLVYVGGDVGFGVYGAVCPALAHFTQHHLQELPATVKREFPHARSIALAGRLPGLMTAAGVPIQAPIVDGLSGTVFAMGATIRALINNLPPQRRANPSIAILGGGGYIGSRLVSVLANNPTSTNAPGKGHSESLFTPQLPSSFDIEPTAALAWLAAAAAAAAALWTLLLK